MLNTANKTKAQLIEIIQEKENEILNLKEDLRLLEKCKKYDDLTDEIKDVYDRLTSKGFKSQEALDIVNTMIYAGQIRTETARYPRVSYVR